MTRAGSLSAHWDFRAVSSPFEAIPSKRLLRAAGAIRERELVTAVEDERRRQAYQQQRYADGLKAVRLTLGVGDEVGFDDTIDQKGLVSLAEAALADAVRTDLPKPPDVASIFAR